MAIMVQFADNTFDFVRNDELDDLIATKSIIAFRRSSGWVEIGKDRIRQERSPRRIIGRERRFSIKFKIY